MQKNSVKQLKKWAERQKAMRFSRAYGASYAKLAKQFKISKQRAYQIVNAKTIEVVNT